MTLYIKHFYFVKHIIYTKILSRQFNQLLFFIFISYQEKWTIDEITETDEINIKGDKGLCSLKLGVNTNHDRCKVCNENLECPGHFGRINLARRVFHIGYIDTVKKILSCVCLNCSKVKTLPQVIISC